MACFSIWDIQNCGCAGGTTCSPCNLPGAAPTATLDDFFCLSGPGDDYPGGTFLLSTFNSGSFTYPPGGLGGFTVNGISWYYLPPVPHVAGQAGMGAVINCSGTPPTLNVYAVFMSAALSGGVWVWAFKGAVGGTDVGATTTYTCSPLHVHLSYADAASATCVFPFTWNGFWDA